MAAVVDEAERRARRRRLVVILVVAGLIAAGFLAFGLLRNRAIDDKVDAATADLRPKWREIDLAQLHAAYDQATFDASSSGDYSAAIELFPTTNDATFVSADLGTPGAVAARYSIDTWLGNECLDVVARAPVPNHLTFETRRGC